MLVLSRCDQPGCCGSRAWEGDKDVSIIGCGEPCSYAMGKSGHGNPPFPIDWRTLLLDALERLYLSEEYGRGERPTSEELYELIAAAKGMQP